MLVYSLGMTLYWSVDFHLPQNQVRAPDKKAAHFFISAITLPHHSHCDSFPLPRSQPVQLSDHLNSLLLSMCEDLAHRRVNLNSVLEACEYQHKASILLPPAKVIRQLVEEVFHESVSLDSYLQYVHVCYVSAHQLLCGKLKAHYKINMKTKIQKKKKIAVRICVLFSSRWTMALCQTATSL